MNAIFGCTKSHLNRRWNKLAFQFFFCLIPPTLENLFTGFIPSFLQHLLNIKKAGSIIRLCGSKLQNHSHERTVWGVITAKILFQILLCRTCLVYNLFAEKNRTEIKQTEESLERQNWNNTSRTELKKSQTKRNRFHSVGWSTEQKLVQRQFIFCCSNFCYVVSVMF